MTDLKFSGATDGAAFHSRYMSPAAREFERFLGNSTIRLPRGIVMSNVTAKPYPDAVADTAIVSLLTRQLRETVRWAGKKIMTKVIASNGAFSGDVPKIVSNVRL